MYAAIKYEDEEIKDFHNKETLEDYKKILREEVKTFANGRQYEIFVRYKSNTIWHFKSNKHE